MEMIESMQDLIENLGTLENYKNNDDPMYVDYYKGLIRRGRCFLVYQRNNEYYFAPSRFIGYKNNSMNEHSANEEKDGRETNPVIHRIIGKPLTPNNNLETTFLQFCKHLDIAPSNVNRKYWSIKTNVAI